MANLQLVLLTSVANLPMVSTTPPMELVANLLPVSLTPVVHLDLRISPRILKNLEMTLLLFSWAWR
jgi:hypothetical protein